MTKTTFSIHYSETLSMNHILYQPAPTFPMHTHDIEEIMLFRKGNGFYHEEGKTYPLRKNSLIISRATRNHGFTFDGDCDYEREIFRSINLRAGDKIVYQRVKGEQIKNHAKIQ